MAGFLSLLQQIFGIQLSLGHDRSVPDRDAMNELAIWGHW